MFNSFKIFKIETVRITRKSDKYTFIDTHFKTLLSIQ